MKYPGVWHAINLATGCGKANLTNRY